MPSYEPLHVRSGYSLGWGSASVNALAEQAARFEHQSLALTDRNSLYGAVPFISACESWDLKPILGAEVTSLEEDESFVVLVRSQAGYRLLCRLLTRRQLDSGFQLLPALLNEVRTSGVRDGIHLLTSHPQHLKQAARVLDRGSVWAALQSPKYTESSWRALVHVASTLRIGVVALPTVNHLKRVDYRLHQTLAAVRENTVIGRLQPSQLAHHDAFLNAPAAIASRYRSFPEALRSTKEIADSCNYVPRRKRWVFPKLDLPEGETAESYLRSLCEGGIHRRFLQRGVSSVHLSRARERLRHELGVISRLGFTDYFVVVGEIVQFAHERGIATVGRGSGAGALTAYLLGITNVDPIRYGLYFERFLHEKRPDCPDLDIDLCWKRRDEVIHYVYDRYGHDRVAMISTHTTFQARSAFREAAKAHGVANRVVNRVSRAVPHGVRGRVSEAVAQSSRSFLVPRHEAPWPQVLRDADGLHHLPRHLGVHPGGMVIADRPIADYVPLERAAKGIVVTQFEMRAVEAVGLVKMDLLGNRALSTIQETVELVETRTGERLDPDTFPDPDPKTAELFTRGDTLGVFQMESPGMRNLNRMLQTRDLATTIAAVALIRPGPAGSGMKEKFVRRSRGLEPVTYLDERLAPLLQETFGVPLYEEDVMCMAAEVAGMTREDGDLFRRSMAAANDQQLQELGRMFKRQAQKRGYSQDRAATIWEQLLQFGSFAFCKAHAAGYGVLAYQAGWLKAHYPLEFTTALMNHHAGMYEKRVHLADAQRNGLKVQLPDINWSGLGFRVEGDTIRIGLDQVTGLQESTQEYIVRERKARPFTSFEDFVTRVPVARSELQALILGGAFDATGLARPELLCALAASFDALRASRKQRSGLDLFGQSAPSATKTIPVLSSFTREEELWLEWDVLGICVGDHPMRYLRRGFNHETHSIAGAERRIGQSVQVAGILAARRTVPTKKGELMQFLTLEDETGMLECTLFPKVFGEHHAEIRGLGPFVAEGVIEDQYGAATLTVNTIRRVSVPQSHSVVSRIGL